MTQVDPTNDAFQQIFAQRRQAVNSLVEQFEGLVGKDAPN